MIFFAGLGKQDKFARAALVHDLEALEEANIDHVSDGPFLLGLVPDRVAVAIEFTVVTRIVASAHVKPQSTYW